MSSNKCVVLGCNCKKKRAKAFCLKHYKIFKKTGIKGFPIRIGTRRSIVRAR